MRRSAVYAAAGLAGSLIVGGAVVAFPSNAFTAKELNLCWVNHSRDTPIDLEAVADGPSYKTTTLDSGQCRQYDVRAGQYKITVEDVQELVTRLNAATTCPGAP